MAMLSPLLQCTDVKYRACMHVSTHTHTHTHIQSREALKKTKRSYGTFENKYQASILSMNIYAAFVNMTMALPLSYACFIITMPIHFS